MMVMGAVVPSTERGGEGKTMALMTVPLTLFAPPPKSETDWEARTSRSTRQVELCGRATSLSSVDVEDGIERKDPVVDNIDIGSLASQGKPTTVVMAVPIVVF